jgi:regulator of CtrA degradation
MAVVPAPNAFLDRTYDETLSMMVEARNYLVFLDPKPKTPVEGLRISCELLRVTSRLTQVMAWLMQQKAVSAGEISLAEALSHERRLAGHDVCTDVSAHADRAIPDGLRDLLDRSHRLFRRIERLEEQIVRSADDQRQITS